MLVVEAADSRYILGARQISDLGVLLRGAERSRSRSFLILK